MPQNQHLSRILWRPPYAATCPKSQILSHLGQDFDILFRVVEGGSKRSRRRRRSQGEREKEEERGRKVNPGGERCHELERDER